MLATFSSSKTLNPLAFSDSSFVTRFHSRHLFLLLENSPIYEELLRRNLLDVHQIVVEKPHSEEAIKLQTAMVSLRRRKFLGLSGKSSFLNLVSDHETGSENPSHFIKLVKGPPFSSMVDSRTGERSTVIAESVNASGSISSDEQTNKPLPGPPVKRRKKHKRKHFEDQEPCLMRGVYFKNMKWQAAIKVDKKQIHLGTVGSQEEAARLYDRAAFMCGREPNFELSEEDKKELSGFKWDEFLAMTRHTLSRKKPTSHRKATKLPI